MFGMALYITLYMQDILELSPLAAGVRFLPLTLVSFFVAPVVLLPGFVVAGVGIGMTNPTIAETAIAVVSPARAGMASGINSTFRQVGIATGVAALGAVFQSRIEAHLTSIPAGSRAGFAEAVSSGAVDQAAAQAPPQLHDQALAAGREAFVAGFNDILLIGAAVAVVGGILGFSLVRKRDHVVAGQGAEAASAA
jgi:hypothetical protein